VLLATNSLCFQAKRRSVQYPRRILNVSFSVFHIPPRPPSQVGRAGHQHGPTADPRGNQNGGTVARSANFENAAPTGEGRRPGSQHASVRIRSGRDVGFVRAEQVPERVLRRRGRARTRKVRMRAQIWPDGVGRSVTKGGSRHHRFRILDGKARGLGKLPRTSATQNEIRPAVALMPVMIRLWRGFSR
jgi:hypothetical protein